MGRLAGVSSVAAVPAPHPLTILTPHTTPPRRYADEYSPVRLEALARSKVSVDRLTEGDLDYASSVQSLAALRGRLKLAVANFVGCCGEYVGYVKKVGGWPGRAGGEGGGGISSGGDGRGDWLRRLAAAHCHPCRTHPPAQALDLEAVCKARQHGLTVRPDGKKGRWADARWAYKCYGRPWVLRAGALLAFASSAVVVWSEATIGSGRSPDLSPFSLMVRSVPHDSEFGEQLLVALPLAYMAACAYFSLLKLGNWSFYHVVGGAEGPAWGAVGGARVAWSEGRSRPAAWGRAALCCCRPPCAHPLPAPAPPLVVDCAGGGRHLGLLPAA